MSDHLLIRRVVFYLGLAYLIINPLAADILNAHKIRQANRSLNKGDLKSASKLYEALPNKTARILFNKGYWQAASGNMSAADNYYHLHINKTAHPKNKARSLYNLGNAYIQHGQLSEAIKNYQQALLLDPSNKKIKHNLELAYLLKAQDKKNKPSEKEQQPSKSNQQKQTEKILDSFKEAETQYIIKSLNQKEIKYHVEKDW